MVKRIETIHNEIVEQIQEMLYNSFPEKLSFNIEYFIGEDTKGRRGLYIELISNTFGLVYERFKPMKEYETLVDVESQFINEVINDLVLAGITFMNAEALMKKGVKDLEKTIRAQPFRRMMPRVAMYMN